jgi:chemotaxis protein methyltransferase CheR
MREFGFSAEHFRLISERVYRFSGIRPAGGQARDGLRALARRLRFAGHLSFDDYVRFLEMEPEEWEHCHQALTTTSPRSTAGAPFQVLGRATAARAGRGGPHLPPLERRLLDGRGALHPSRCAFHGRRFAGGPFQTCSLPISTQVLATGAGSDYPLNSVLRCRESASKRFFQRGTGRIRGAGRVRARSAPAWSSRGSTSWTRAGPSRAGSTPSSAAT